MKKDNMKVRAGRLGALATHQERFKAIEVLRSKYSKAQLDKMLKWPSGALIEIAKYIKN